MVPNSKRKLIDTSNMSWRKYLTKIINTIEDLITNYDPEIQTIKNFDASQINSIKSKSIAINLLSPYVNNKINTSVNDIGIDDCSIITSYDVNIGYVVRGLSQSVSLDVEVLRSEIISKFNKDPEWKYLKGYSSLCTVIGNSKMPTTSGKYKGFMFANSVLHVQLTKR
jgi:hypothetical protein